MNEPARESLVIESLAGYEGEIGRWVAALEEARQRTLHSLRGIQPAVLDRVPEDGSGNSIGTLLYHIALIEADWLFVEVLEQDTFPADLMAVLNIEVRDEAGRLSPSKGEGLESYLRRLELVRGHLLATFRDMSLEDFYRPRHLEQYDVTPVWVLHHLMQHEAEHRGQIGELRTRVEAML